MWGKHDPGSRPNLETLKNDMLNDDEEHEIISAPDSGAVARAEGAERVRVLEEKFANAELLWAQRGRGGGQAGGGRPAAAYTVCYCCGAKGHYSKDCSQQASARCNYCKKQGHKEVVCRMKQRDSEDSAHANNDDSEDTSGEAKIFKGGPAECNMAELGPASRVDFSKLRSGLPSQSQSTEWLCDTAASHHIVNDKTLLKNIRPYRGGFEVLQIKGSVEVTQIGTVVIQVDGEDGKTDLILEDVLLLESLRFNIYSLQRARQSDYIYDFSKAASHKIGLLKRLGRATEQVALISEESGRWTLDCNTYHNCAETQSPSTLPKPCLRGPIASSPICPQTLPVHIITPPGPAPSPTYRSIVSGSLQGGRTRMSCNPTTDHHPSTVKHSAYLMQQIHNSSWESQENLQGAVVHTDWVGDEGGVVLALATAGSMVSLTTAEPQKKPKKSLRSFQQQHL